MENDFINIVFCGDKNYARIIGVAMISIIKNLAKDKVARFFIFSQGFSQQNIDELNKIKDKFNCEIINVPMEQYMDFFNFADVSKFKNQYISIACYFRLLIFKILPEDIENCFFVDGDMIVECDLSKITLPENKIFAAVMEAHAMNYREKILSHLYKMPEYTKFKEKPFEFPYFNAGFFCANIKKCKELNIFDEMTEFLKNNPSPPYADQDTLNAIFGQKHHDLIEFLPLEYNVFTLCNYNEPYDNLPYPKSVLMKAVNNPKIIHFAGRIKPWNTINKKIILNYDVWWKYYKISPWKNSYLIQKIKIVLSNTKQFNKKIKQTFIAIKLGL